MNGVPNGGVTPRLTCNGCGHPLLLENLLCEDGCPCNTPRGVNYKPVPCAICGEPCTRPGHHLKAVVGFDPFEIPTRGVIEPEIPHNKSINDGRRANSELLTKDENDALKLSGLLFNVFHNLPVLHASDRAETIRDIHDIQNRIMSRAVFRELNGGAK